MAITHANDFVLFIQAIHENQEVKYHIAIDKLLPRDMIEERVAQGQTVTPTMRLFKCGSHSFVLEAIPNLFHIHFQRSNIMRFDMKLDLLRKRQYEPQRLWRQKVHG